MSESEQTFTRKRFCRIRSWLQFTFRHLVESFRTQLCITSLSSKKVTFTNLNPKLIKTFVPPQILFSNGPTLPCWFRLWPAPPPATLGGKRTQTEMKPRQVNRTSRANQSLDWDFGQNKEQLILQSSWTFSLQQPIIIWSSLHTSLKSPNCPLHVSS